MIKNIKRVLLLSCMVLIIPFFSAFGENAAHRELGIGVISPKPDKRLRDYAPLAQYLAERLAPLAVDKVNVLVAKDIEEMYRLIEQGAVDVALESALSTIEMEKAGMVPSLLAWRKGVRDYHTLFVVRKDSPLKTLEDLKGKTIVFEDAHSTSAFAVPMAELKKKGLRPASAEQTPKTEDAVTFSFAGVALNEAYWVAQRKADAAAFSNNDWDSLPETVRSELRIMHETSPILRYIVSIRRDLPAAIRQRLESILVEMDSTADGLRVLQSASEIKKIERFSAEDFRSLDYVRSLVTLLN